MRHKMLEDLMVGFMEGALINTRIPQNAEVMSSPEYRRDLATVAKSLLNMTCPDINTSVMVVDNDQYPPMMNKIKLWIEVYVRSKTDDKILGVYTGLLWHNDNVTVKYNAIKKELSEHWFDQETGEWKERLYH
jgi:hypothetical protein